MPEIFCTSFGAALGWIRVLDLRVLNPQWFAYHFMTRLYQVEGCPADYIKLMQGSRYFVNCITREGTSSSINADSVKDLELVVYGISTV